MSGTFSPGAGQVSPCCDDPKWKRQSMRIVLKVAALGSTLDLPCENCGRVAHFIIQARQVPERKDTGRAA